ncbi:MAG TPA: sigma-70 family RNA polymerase sigma factor [Candidatus Dojkabacteria bacterium]|nr:sigma-70 family RNA polymerase sigma factor [Candidatus Dojkabacteria bacterium]
MLNKTSAENFSQIYESNFKKIYRFFYYKTNSIQDSEDLTSEVFIAFAENINKTNINNDTAFLYGIAKNIFFNYLKRKKYTITVDWDTFDFYEYVENTFHKKVKSQSLDEKVKKYIPKLPTKQRIVAELRFAQKMSLIEICQRLNKSMTYVKTTQNRAIKKLKFIVENEERKSKN